MKYSPKDVILAQRQLRQKINSIPKQNKQKFAVDLIKLIDKAHDEDYKDFSF